MMDDDGVDAGRRQLAHGLYLDTYEVENPDFSP